MKPLSWNLSGYRIIPSGRAAKFALAAPFCGGFALGFWAIGWTKPGLYLAQQMWAWQSLIAGIGAVCAALIAAWPVYRQIGETQRQTALMSIEVLRIAAEEAEQEARAIGKIRAMLTMMADILDRFSTAQRDEGISVRETNTLVGYISEEISIIDKISKRQTGTNLLAMRKQAINLVDGVEANYRSFRDFYHDTGSGHPTAAVRVKDDDFQNKARSSADYCREVFSRTAKYHMSADRVSIIKWKRARRTEEYASS